MAETIVDGTLFNPEIIRYSAPKASGSGGKSVNILNKEVRSSLRISTPLMLTWGASDFVDEKTGEGNGKYEMALQFPSDEYKNADTDAFLANIQAFEKKVKHDALTYSKDWFGKVHKSDDVISALWTPVLKYSKDKVTGEPDLSKAPTIRIKIPIWENVWKVEIYDEEGSALFPNLSNPGVTPLDFLSKGINVALVIQCGGLWFANGKFGMTWKLVQAVVQKPRAALTGKCFIQLKASDKEKLKTSAPVVDDGDVEGPGALVEDSDEEEDDEVAPVVAPPPAPAPAQAPAPVPEVAATPPPAEKKKVVKKKVVA